MRLIIRFLRHPGIILFFYFFCGLSSGRLYADGLNNIDTIHKTEKLRDEDSIRAQTNNFEQIITDRLVRQPKGLKWKNIDLVEKILVFFLLIFLVMVMAGLSVILTLRILKTFKEKKALIVSQEFEEFVTHILFSDDVPEEGKFFSDQEIIRILSFAEHSLSGEFNRNVIMDFLLGLHRNLSGESAEKLKQLYFIFELDRDSIQKLKDKKWFLKAKAIKELEQMEVRKAYRSIYRCINHPNVILRSEAQLAIVSLKRTNQFTFLFNLRTELSEWQQLNLLNRLKSTKDLKTQDVPRLLNSMNESVVRLGIKMIQHLNLVEYEDNLPELVSDPKEKIRIDAIRCLAFLQVDSACELLKSRYEDEIPEVQKEILDAIGSLGKHSDLNWVSERMHSHVLALTNAARKAMLQLTYQEN